jgi:hypothetical protein
VENDCCLVENLVDYTSFGINCVAILVNMCAFERRCSEMHAKTVSATTSDEYHIDK